MPFVLWVPAGLLTIAAVVDLRSREIPDAIPVALLAWAILSVSCGWVGLAWWEVPVGVRNPFGFPVEVALTVVVRGGAFEVEGVPVALELAPGEKVDVPITLGGGSWSPGDDPVVLARFVWARGPGRPREDLFLDAPLARVRTLSLGTDARRLPMLCEHPRQPEASMALLRRGEELLACCTADWGEAAQR